MKMWMLSYCVFISCLSYAQNNKAPISEISFSVVDRFSKDIEAETPALLALQLTQPYQSELEKVRSIFGWITTNVSYNVRRYNKPRNRKAALYDDDDDTSALPSLNERVSINILKSREAVCDGYARLFKNLCDHAGIRAEIIHGYAKINGRPPRFASNHAWNAVYIDSNWFLLDVTWAAGFLNQSTNEFVSSLNDKYFLADPKAFVVEHYPEDLRWTLLLEPPALKEFQKIPFQYSAYNRRQVISHFPAVGTIEASLGDTVWVHIESAETVQHLFVTSDLYVDTAAIATTEWQSILPKPPTKNGYKAKAYFLVDSIATEWLHIIYNHEIILRYKLNVSSKNELFAAGRLLRND